MEEGLSNWVTSVAGFICILVIVLRSISKDSVKSKLPNNKNDSILRIKQKVFKTDCIVEVCLSDIESIENARRGNADSIEICSSRDEGGITPSIGLIQQAVDLLNGTDIEIHVLIRPRPGNFCYTHNEFDVIVRDVIAAKEAGVDGVVVGVLDKYGNIDQVRLNIIRQISKGISLTFHRAFDVCSQSVEDALDIIMNAGCDRLLTSGRSSSAGCTEGLHQLKSLVQQSNGRIKLIAAGGVTVNNVEDILSFTGVQGVHAGSAVTTLITHTESSLSSFSTSVYTTTNMDDTDMDIHSSLESTEVITTSSGLSIGLSPDEDLNSWHIVDVELTRKLVECVNNFSNNNRNSIWRNIDETADCNDLAFETMNEEFESIVENDVDNGLNESVKVVLHSNKNTMIAECDLPSTIDRFMQHEDNNCNLDMFPISS